VVVVDQITLPLVVPVVELVEQMERLILLIGDDQVSAEHKLPQVVLPIKLLHRTSKYPVAHLVGAEPELTISVRVAAVVGTAVAAVSTTLAEVAGLVMLVELLQQL
jgi:hypothetical protein